MDYNLISKENKNTNLITQIFLNRGFKQDEISHYLNTTDADIINPCLLKNIDKGIEILRDCIDNNKKIFIVPDVDADGLTSAAILINYLYALNPEYTRNFITYRINEGKQHGIVLQNIPDDVDTVIYPDSASNDYEQHKILYKRGIRVLVLDHHEAEKESEYACIINNQLCDYPNKTLSGAGIVYKFCCRMDEIFNVHYADLFLDLVALGMVSDMMDVRAFETKHLIQKGIANIRNPLFHGLKTKNAYSIGDTLTPFGISFYITPYINATIRMGTEEEKLTLFESMLDFKAYEQIPSTKRGCKGQMETRVEQACRNCTNIKNRQTKARDAGLEEVEGLIEQYGLLNNKILTVLLSQGSMLKNTLTGLVANQLMAKYQKPVLLLHERENTFEGSARGCNQSKLEDFKEFLNQTNLVEYGEGHAQAFGCGIHKDKIAEFIETTNKLLESYDFNTSYKVDAIFNGENFLIQDILDIAELKSLYGQGFEEPYIAIENLTVTKDNLVLMSPDKKPTLKIKLHNGCSLIKFKSSKEEYEQLYSDTGCIKINIVGKCEKNVWNGNISAQIIVSDYEIISTQNYYF